MQINQSPVPVAVQHPKLCSNYHFPRDTQFFSSSFFPRPRRKIGYNLFQQQRKPATYCIGHLLPHDQTYGISTKSLIFLGFTVHVPDGKELNQIKCKPEELTW